MKTKSMQKGRKTFHGHKNGNWQGEPHEESDAHSNNQHESSHFKYASEHHFPQYFR